MNELISIIVPVFNAQEYLEQTVDCLINQTYNNIEILLLNDGSTDNSLNICRNLEKKDKRIIVIDKANEGICRTRNLGMKLAKGSWIMFCDNDDILSVNCISEVMDIANNNCVDLVRFRRRREFWKKGKMIATESTPTFEAQLVKVDSFSRYLCALQCGYGVWTGIYKKEFIDNHNIIFDTSITHGFEDHIFVSEILSNCSKVYITPNEYYIWIQREGHSTSTNRSRTAVNNRIYAIKKWFDIEKDFSQKTDNDGSFQLRKMHFAMFCRAELKNADIPRAEASLLYKQFLSEINFTDLKYSALRNLGIKEKIWYLLSCYFPIIAVQKIHN